MGESHSAHHRHRQAEQTTAGAASVLVCPCGGRVMAAPAETNHRPARPAARAVRPRPGRAPPPSARFHPARPQGKLEAYAAELCATAGLADPAEPEDRYADLRDTALRKLRAAANATLSAGSIAR
jgi:hypothetical protein